MTAYILDAVRTPRAKARPDGALASLKPEALVAGLIEAIEARGHAAKSAEGLYLGSVGQVGAQGGHIALISKLKAGLSDDAFAISLNNYCVSSLTAVGEAAAKVASGQADLVLAGGVEMMSRVPFMADRADYYSDLSFDSRTRYIPVAVAADRLAGDLDISREELDAVALTSQQRAAAAEGTALNASRISINGLDHDEATRPKTTAEGLAALPPAFEAMAQPYAAALEGQSITWRHTISHAPPMTDGASMALISSLPEGARAKIIASVEVGGDPYASLTAGFSAMKKALEKAGLTLDDMDRIEFMEAFAVTIARLLRDYPVDHDRVNVGGGHIAKGHPMGASGGILLSSLLDALDECQGRYGLVVMTGAQGVGSAMVVERLGF